MKANISRPAKSVALIFFPHEIQKNVQNEATRMSLALHCVKIFIYLVQIRMVSTKCAFTEFSMLLLNFRYKLLKGGK